MKKPLAWFGLAGLVAQVPYNNANQIFPLYAAGITQDTEYIINETQHLVLPGWREVQACSVPSVRMLKAK
jgi:hypothetical protein